MTVCNDRVRVQVPCAGDKGPETPDGTQRSNTAAPSPPAETQARPGPPHAVHRSLVPCPSSIYAESVHAVQDRVLSLENVYAGMSSLFCALEGRLIDLVERRRELTDTNGDLERKLSGHLIKLKDKDDLCESLKRNVESLNEDLQRLTGEKRVLQAAVLESEHELRESTAKLSRDVSLSQSALKLEKARQNDVEDEVKSLKAALDASNAAREQLRVDIMAEREATRGRIKDSELILETMNHLKGEVEKIHGTQEYQVDVFERYKETSEARLQCANQSADEARAAQETEAQAHREREAHLTSEIQKMLEIFHSTESKLASCEENLLSSRAAIETLEKEKGCLESQLAAMRGDFDTSREHYQQYRDTIDAELAELKEAGSRARAEGVALRQELDTCKEAHGQAQASIKRLSTENSELLSAVEDTKMLLLAARAELGPYKSSLEEMRQRVEGLQREKEVIQSALQEKDRSLVNARAELGPYKSSLEEMRQRVEGLQREKEVIQSALQEKDRSLVNARAELGPYKSSLEEMRQRVEGLQRDKEVIQSALQEKDRSFGVRDAATRSDRLQAPVAAAFPGSGSVHPGSEAMNAKGRNVAKAVKPAVERKIRKRRIAVQRS
jgi:chromosome segregation ATPase